MKSYERSAVSYEQTIPAFFWLKAQDSKLKAASGAS